MENLIRLQYCPELNQNKLLSRRVRRHLSSDQDISEVINEIIDEVESEDGVTLCYCFSNRDMRKSHNWGYSVLIFPKYGKIEYSLKKGSFWVNQGDDPIMIHGIYLPRNNKFFSSELLLFRENAFENKQKYKHINTYGFGQMPYVFQKDKKII